MSIEAVNRHFVQRFVNNFGAPQAPDVSGLYSEYERALAGTDEDLLREAAAYVIDHHDYPQRWPTVAECKKAVDHVATERAEVARRRVFTAKAEKPWTEASHESKARVEAMMRDCLSKLKVSGPPPGKVAPLPDVSRDAWERRFGRG